MVLKQLPIRSSLERYEKQSKELVKAKPPFDDTQETVHPELVGVERGL